MHGLISTICGIVQTSDEFTVYTDLVIDPVSMFGNTFVRRFLFSAECEIFGIISHFDTDEMPESRFAS